MRLRKVKNAREILASDSKYFIHDNESNKGKWKNVFGNNNPVHIEIGCGKGQFIIGLAKEFPNINFIAIEKFDSVLIRTLEKSLEHDLPNLRLMLADALLLNDIFGNNEVNNIYLNFSDPWPKTKHSKRRLTSSLFLDVYKGILVEDGSIIQKTDNRGLFESSLESFSLNSWFLYDISLDLHKDNVFNITTEYEDKWSKLGPIYRLEAKKTKKVL